MVTYGRESAYLSVALLAAMLVTPYGVIAQDSTHDAASVHLSLAEIVNNMTDRNAERAKALGHYQGRREYQVDYKGFYGDIHAEMVVTVRYDAPATEEFTVVSQSGSKWMINHVIKRLLETERESIKDQNRPGIQITSDNYDFTLLESHAAVDGCPYVLGVQPRVPTKFLFRGRIWVDAKDFAVCRIDAEPAKNPSFWIKKTEIHHSFVKLGEFWLPAENKSVSDIRLNGRATLTINYEDYKFQGTSSVQANETRPATTINRPAKPSGLQ
jgi:hypothetical protein